MFHYQLDAVPIKQILLDSSTLFKDSLGNKSSLLLFFQWKEFVGINFPAIRKICLM